MTDFVKKYLGWIVAIPLAILGALFCIKHERAKMAKLKADVVVTRKQKKIAQLRKKRATLDAQDTATVQRDREISTRIKATTAEIEAVRERARVLDHDQVVHEFNRLYHTSESSAGASG